MSRLIPRAAAHLRAAGDGAAAAVGRVQHPTRLRGAFDSSDIAFFQEICSQKTDSTRYPLSSAVKKNVVIYNGDSVRNLLLESTDNRDALMAEFHDCLFHGPGVFAIEQCVADSKVIERTNRTFTEIINKEKAEMRVKGDHFAPGGKNDRIWNSFQKHAEVDPRGFTEYYANEIIDCVCEAWLGPGYQMSAQANIVKPGGRAQQPHRDYHLGFQSETTAARFPIVSQIASQLLTLQGAIAHTDMPINTGPTQLLPFSQHFDYGYTAYRHAEFREVFAAQMVQLELKQGDAVFFNPALFHAAGDNDSESQERWANLLQISASWGKAMESIDRRKILDVTWPHVLKMAKELGNESPRVEALLKAICDGYSFPTNLDLDPPPADGHCPPTQLDRAVEAVSSSAPAQVLSKTMDDYDRMRAP